MFMSIIQKTKLMLELLGTVIYPLSLSSEIGINWRKLTHETITSFKGSLGV